MHNSEVHNAGTECKPPLSFLMDQKIIFRGSKISESIPRCINFEKKEYYSETWIWKEIYSKNGVKVTVLSYFRYSLFESIKKFEIDVGLLKKIMVKI